MEYIINCPQCGLKSRFMPEEDDEKKEKEQLY